MTGKSDGSVGGSYEGGRADRSLGGSTSRLVNILAFDVPTTICALLLLVMLPAFIFDERLSAVMSAFGFDTEKVSHIWFLRDQYDYLKDWRRVPDLSVALFHVSELFVWLSIAICAARLLVGLTFLGTVEDARYTMQKWSRRPISGPIYFLGYLVIFGGSLASVVTNRGIDIITSVHWMTTILERSPKAYIFIMTFVFCGASVLLVEGALVLVQLNFGKHEHKT
jgi:hypothetical protein